jgi:transcriptional regulator with XRE-family HTH domain
MPALLKTMKSKIPNTVNYEALGRLLRDYRVREGISLRSAALQTGISPSTLSRVESGKTMELMHVIALADWLGVSVKEFASEPVGNLPRKVKAMLLADPKLGRDEADVLGATFSTLYRQMSK